MPDSRTGSQGFAYQAIDTGDGTVLMKESLKDTRTRRSQRRCIDTQGSAFNLLVSLVLCVNAVILCLEADLDMLSVESQHFRPAGLGTNIGLVGVNGQPATNVPPPGHYDTGADSTKRWGGLESDMGLVGINSQEQADLEADIKQGLKADESLKATMQQKVDSILTKDNVNIQDSLKSGAYNVMEFFFIAFFVIEFCLRLCDLGCQEYWGDPWSVVDFTVIVAGVIDLALPLVTTTMNGKSTTEQVLRLLRVLRVLRLFRAVEALRTVGKALLHALYAVIWVFVLICIVNLVCSIFLTTFIGQRAYLWNENAEEVHAWFGSIGRTMVTLCTIMTLSGWDHIAAVLVNVIPRLAVMSAFFSYILVCSFTVLGLIVGMINAALISSRLDDEKHSAQRSQEKRAAFASVFTEILATCEQSQNGYLSRDEFNAALESRPAVLFHLKKLDIDTSTDELLMVYDRLSQDAAFDGAIKIVHLVEAMINLSGAAHAWGVFDLKYQFSGMRRDTKKQVADVAKELGAKNEISTAATGARVDELQQKVESMHHELSTVVTVLAAVNKKIESFEKLEEQERSRHNEALNATNSKLDTLFTQLNSTLFALTSRVAAQSSVVEKVDAVSAQVAAQATLKDKIHDLGLQLKDTHASVHEKLDGHSTQLTQHSDTLHSKLETHLETLSSRDSKLRTLGKESEASADGEETTAKKLSVEGEEATEKEATEKKRVVKDDTVELS